VCVVVVRDARTACSAGGTVGEGGERQPRRSESVEGRRG